MSGDIARRVTDEILSRIGASDPAAINRGNCDTWANRFADLTGGAAVWLDHIIDADAFPIDEQPRIGHCVARLGERWYDSEHPDGVDDLGILAGLAPGRLALFAPSAAKWGAP